MQIDGTERKTNPTENWLSLPCFCAMAIFTLLSSACWLFYQTKRGLCVMKRLAVFHILVLWNGLSLSVSEMLLYLFLPLSLSLSLHVGFWLSQRPLVRRALFGVTWDKKRPTRQLCYSSLLLDWGKYCDVQVMCGLVAIIKLKPVVQSDWTATDTKQVDN